MSHHTYAKENALVDSEWALAHLNDPNVRFVEVDVDTTAFEQSHIPGAVGWNWTSQLSDGIRRDIAGREDFSKLLSESGIGPDTTVVLYGDNNNWFAAWAYWQLKLYGHQDVRILNGGRKFWLDNGLALSVEDPSVTATGYQLPEADRSAEKSSRLAMSRRIPSDSWLVQFQPTAPGIWLCSYAVVSTSTSTKRTFGSSMWACAQVASTSVSSVAYP